MQYLNICDAYAVQCRFASASQDIKAWKLGGTNTATRDLFDVKEPYFGFLRESQIFGLGYRPAKQLDLNTFEVEVCILTPKNYDPVKSYTTTEINEWPAFLGLEFPQTQIANLPDKGVAHLIADNCAAGALFVSEIPFKYGCGLSLEVKINGVEVSKKIDLIDNVSEIIRKFLEINKRHGFETHANQLIATGGLTELLTIRQGDSISIRQNAELILEFVK